MNPPDKQIISLNVDEIFRLLPGRSKDSHKGSFGKLLNVSSSFSMNGAGRLSCMGAHRVGTGIVILACPRSVVPIQSASLTETIFAPLPETPEGNSSGTAASIITERLKTSTACMIGCGLGLCEDTKALVRFVIENTKCPVLLDADALNCISDNMSILNHAKSPLCLTPHIGEMARLCGVTNSEIIADKLRFGIELVKKYSCTLVLKSHKTLVFSPDGRIFENTTGNNGLAKGGSGDVLAGMLGGLMAQGMDVTNAAICAVYLHGLAADRCAKRLSARAMQPSELLNDLCEIFLEQESE